MKIDIYSICDPWDPTCWSGTNCELAEALENLGVLRNIFNANPPQETDILTRLLDALVYRRLSGLRISYVTEHHPRHIKSRWKYACNILRNNPGSDAIIMISDIAPFKGSPFFTFQDVDIATIVKWRELGKKTFMYDHYPMSILNKRHELQKEVYANATGIMVASDWVADSIRSYVDNPDKVCVTGIGHGYKPIEMNESLIHRRFEHPILLFVGKDGIRKGLDVAFSAFRLLLQEHPEARMKVVTNCDTLPERLKKELRSCPQLTMHSNLSSADLSELYRGSSVFIMPSRFEPWGKVFFEAMSFGLPVIGTKCCAMPEFITDGCNGYTAKCDEFDVAKRAEDLLKSFNKYKKTSRNALDTGGQYTWTHVARRMLKFIDDSIT
ncbi:MAG: glycosyltransferase family 4 protein [Halobacteriota archaeon]